MGKNTQLTDLEFMYGHDEFVYTEVVLIRSTIKASLFSGLLTRVEIGHIRIKLRRERPHQVTRVRLFAQPSSVVYGSED